MDVTTPLDSAARLAPDAEVFSLFRRTKHGEWAFAETIGQSARLRVQSDQYPSCSRPLQVRNHNNGCDETIGHCSNDVFRCETVTMGVPRPLDIVASSGAKQWKWV